MWSCIAFELFCVNWNMPKWLFRPLFIPSSTRWVIKCHFALEIQVCRTSSVRHGVSGGRLVDAHSTNFCVISRSGKFICKTKLIFVLVCHWPSRFFPRRNGEYSSTSCFKMLDCLISRIFFNRFSFFLTGSNQRLVTACWELWDVKSVPCPLSGSGPGPYSHAHDQRRSERRKFTCALTSEWRCALFILFLL